MNPTTSAPSRIGAYPIERELGRGGMGVVYLARDPRLDRAVAIKVLPDAFAHDPERIARFEREARLLASLHHPNIGGIFGLEESDGRRFLVLEYVEGDTLAERLARGKLPLDETLDVCRQIAAALEAAHEGGIVHRDLKPGNVKLTPGGEVKVLDFGLAKGGTGSASDPDLSHSPTLTQMATGAGVILGTAAYMSPEQARGKAVDRRTDIWSYGCVLYECLTGRQLFGGETVSDTIARILEREPDWSALPGDTPPAVRQLVQRCLEKDAKRRLRDIGEARIAIEEALAPRAGTSGVRFAPAGAPVRAGAASPRLAWGVAAVLAIATLALAIPRLLSPGAPAQAVRFAVGLQGLYLGDAASLAISPNGRMLVFSVPDSTGTPALWLRPLDVMTPRRLPGTENASIPFWSPDNRMIGFFADGKLKKVGLTGSPPEVLCDAPSPRGGAWSPRHVIVFAPAGQGPVERVSDGGGDPVAVTHLDASRHETAHRFPCFLPDGRHFIYMALPRSRGHNVIVGDIEGHPGRLLTMVDVGAAYAPPGWLLFSKNDILCAQRFDAGALRLHGDPVPLGERAGSSSMDGYPNFSVSGTGVLVHAGGQAVKGHLVWLDRAGAQVGTIPAPLAQYQALSVSPDGHSAVAAIGSSSTTADLWLVDLDRGSVTRFTFGSSATENPSWSPDGRTIAWDENPNGVFDVFVKPAAGGTGRLVYHSGAVFKHVTGWTPDGRSIVFESLDANTGFDLLVAPLDGGRAPVYLQGPSNERFGAVSPDGRWMAYSSDESGRYEIFVQSYPQPGTRYRVSLYGGFAPAWRNDGREIVFITPDFQTLMSVDVQSGPELHFGTPRALFHPPRNSIGTPGIAADFRRFLYAVQPEESAPNPVEVLMNWPAAMEKP